MTKLQHLATLLPKPGLSRIGSKAAVDKSSFAVQSMEALKYCIILQKKGEKVCPLLLHGSVAHAQMKV